MEIFPRKVLCPVVLKFIELFVFFVTEDSELGCLVGGFQVFVLWATSRWAIQAKD